MLRSIVAIALCAALCGVPPAPEPPATPEKDAPKPGAAAAAAAAANPLESYRAAVRAIVEEALKSGRALERVAQLCAIAPRRLSGSADAAAAVEWARRAMEEDGLENVRLEEITVPHWVRGTVESLVISAPAAHERTPLPILALGGSVGTPPEGIVAPVIEAKDFEALAALGERARGAIVFFNHPMDRAKLDPFDAYGDAVEYRWRGAMRAAAAGAVAVVVRSMTTALDDVPHTGSMGYDDDLPKIPACAVSTLGAERLATLLATGEKVVLALRLDCATLENEKSHNVVGELRGTTKPDEVVVIGGHLDAWDVGQGAHDDAAGCCHALEALRLLKSLGLRPKRTLRAVFFMNEENGLAGGRGYHERYMPEMGRHVLAIESDRGGFAPRGFTTDANPEAFAALKPIAALLAEFDAGRLDPGGGGADISPMKADGVVTMGFLPDWHRYFDLHHTHEDTIEKVNERELNLGAAVIAAMAYIVADLDAPLPRNEPKPK
ncbi:MAG: M20/M25/M40 family metallo-hydrolase [Planctomycetes bacterium]|nr:M20/M25/M40 family metallo-hydrolase [Planctomycetota bacterium]